MNATQILAKLAQALLAVALSAVMSAVTFAVTGMLFVV
jgi:hypothetical protein